MDNNRFNILYVDDEEINLRVFKSSFRRDFNVFLANSAKEGLDVLENNRIDVVITDQRMPEITGVEFLKTIHERFPSIPPNRLILSGFAKDEEIEVAFKNYLLFSFISKPWNAEELKEIIINAIEYGKRR
jgi:response regulator RpfG family c-di-GMP phosphodiesterase